MENVRILEEVVTFQTCCPAGNNRTVLANYKLTNFTYDRILQFQAVV